MKSLHLTGKQGLPLLEFDGSQLPDDIQYKGDIVMGERWNDQMGENFLILTETETRETDQEGEPALSANLYGYHFAINNGETALLWEIEGAETNCLWDLTLNHIPRSLTITDLDKDGLAESTFLFLRACRSDMSPASLKLHMHEGRESYSLSGKTVLDGEIPDPLYTPNPAYETANEAFKTYADEQWKAFYEEY